MWTYLYPETLRHPEEGREPVLVDADLSPVHEVEEAAHVAVGDVLQDDDGVFVGVVDEQRLEVGAARGEYHFVGAEELSFHGQRDVDETLVVEELVEY